MAQIGRVAAPSSAILGWRLLRGDILTMIEVRHIATMGGRRSSCWSSLVFLKGLPQRDFLSLCFPVFFVWRVLTLQLTQTMTSLEVHNITLITQLGFAKPTKC